MRQFFIHNGQSEIGPFDLEQLKSQSLTKDTPIWYEGLENWTTAEKVEELKSLFTLKSTPPPLVKQIVETSPTPPNFKTNTFNNSNAVNETPLKKKSFVIPAVIGGVIVLGSLVAWLVYINSQNSSTINSLQEQVTTQDNTIQTQQNQDDEKEAERKRINAAVTEKNMNFRNNFENYIKVQNDDPSVDYTLGGISEFNVYVSNETTYLLDQVDIYIQYIRKNGELAQDKTISLFNVPAGSSETGIAPSSVNGVKVNCSISKIISKKMHFCFPSDNGNPEDPYFCK
jgi:hypothetical protein